MSEIRWLEKGEIFSGKYAVFYSGGIKAEKSVAVVLRYYIFKHVTKVKCYSDESMFVNIRAKPVIVVTHTNNGSHDNIEKKKCTMRSVSYCIKKEQVDSIVMGDFNGIVAEGSTNNVLGTFELKSKIVLYLYLF